ncbi:Crp/Fnr family transcriptional regulator [Photobacterium sp. 1_MG-2023]|uniref:Crp/Fnr family transcriptional regulator n=1 Tax=Photobacterium sp. 1_MG-2023 TaxID=3062646 RepID=UPI0026E2D1D5|nr:Crp/Fnr family transcriptional regulator [Photobacterium sp. 1_MG-2023]MDO6708785.1 Crp/Fnr family transcriptional regulator [Photobacterium sp. 1_MG-2023]
MNAPLSQFLALHAASPEAIAQAETVAETLELPTRHILLNQGELATQAFFLIDGLCHACYLTAEGHAISKDFFWEQELLIGFESLLTEEGSPYLLETLSACRVLTLPIDLILNWRETCPDLYMALAERQLLFREQKEQFMRLYSPARRYALFTESIGDFAAHISNTQLASYLGLSATQLDSLKRHLHTPPESSAP